MKISSSKPAVCMELGGIVVACHWVQQWEQENGAINKSCFVENSNGNSKLVRETPSIALFELQPKNESIKSYSISSFPTSSFIIFLSPQVQFHLLVPHLDTRPPRGILSPERDKGDNTSFTMNRA